MSTYGDLKTDFLDLLKRRDISTTRRDRYIQDGLARCQTLLRIPAMEKQFSMTVDDSMGGAIPIPADYLEMRSLFAGAYEAHQRTLGAVKRLRLSGPTTNYPSAYARLGPNWLLGPYPLSGTVIDGDYYAELGALAVDADSNWLSLNRPNAILFAALSDAAPNYVDRRGDTWEQKFQQVIGELTAQAEDDELTNGQVEPAFYFCDDE